MNEPTNPPTTLPQVSRPAASPIVRSRSARKSWLTLLGSVSFHAAVFAIDAHFVTGLGGDHARPAAADVGDEMSLSVKIASFTPAKPRAARAMANPNVVRRALPAQQQRVMTAARTDFALPAPEPQLDLPEPRLPERKPAQSAEASSPDAPGQAGGLAVDSSAVVRVSFRLEG